MHPRIDRADIDYNTVKWRDERITIARHSDTHVRISRYGQRRSRHLWDLMIDATSGYPELQVAYGNRLACIADEHILATTSGEHIREGSLHNHQLHYISGDGEILWSLPWQTIQRYTLVGEHLLVARFLSPPNYWVQDTPLEAHLLDPETGDSVACVPIQIPPDLLPHYQSWQVSDLRAYLVWKHGELVVTVRPYFRANYKPANELGQRGAFKRVLDFP